jgi:lipoate-protein ligase A
MQVADTAQDEALLTAAAEGQPGLRVYRPEGVAVVLGRGSKRELELHHDECLADGVPVLRRLGGGCAVVVDPGNVIVAVALPVQGIGDNPRHFARLSSWLLDGLARLGVEGLYSDGISDLVREDRKVGGACIYRRRGVLLYGATLLVEPRQELIERYLRHPPREPEYRRGRSHREFLGQLAPMVPDAAWLERQLAQTLEVDRLTAAE